MQGACSWGPRPVTGHHHLHHPTSAHHHPSSLLAPTELTFPLVITWVVTNANPQPQVGINYDPMIAKLIVWGEDRGAALRALTSALAETQVRAASSHMVWGA